MALRGKSLILYGLEVTEFNSSIDFKITGGGVEKQATLQLGFYSLTGLMVEIKRAMQAADSTNTYGVTANRTVNGGLENRITISTSGVFLSLLFSTGSRAASSVASLIGFSGDQTGSTNYTSTSSAGTRLIPEFAGYNYLGPEFDRKVQGVVSITASGQKEALVWQIQHFISVEFKYEPTAKWIVEWLPFVDWMITQKLFEFTPEYESNPNTFYEVTLETSSNDGKGLGMIGKEMLPQFPFNHQTGPMKFRERQD